MSNVASLVFYIGLFTVSGGALLLNKTGNKYLKRIAFFISVVIPTLISAFRFQVGTDYPNYSFLFDYIRIHTWSEILVTDIRWEIGFKILVKLLTSVGNNRFVFGSLSFFTFVFILKALEYYENIDAEISYIVYLFVYFSGDMNIVRQSLAFAIVLFAYHYIFENQKYKFVLWIMLAATIHISAIIVIPVYFLWNQEKNELISFKIRVLIYGVFIIGTFLWRGILKFLISMNLPFISKFEYLLNNNNGLNRDLFVKLMILIVFIIWSYKFEIISSKNKLFIFLFALNCIISFTGYQITFFKRIALYFEIPFIVLIGEIPCFFAKGKSRIFIKCSIVLISCFYFILSAYVLGHAEIIPYKWR